MENSNYNTFMAKDLTAYTGQWIAIKNKEIISHGTSFKKVFSEAKKLSPKERPFIAKVPTGDTMIF